MFNGFSGSWLFFVAQPFTANGTKLSRKALKGRDSIASGNATGDNPENFPSPERRNWRGYCALSGLGLLICHHTGRCPVLLDAAAPSGL
jgi:hypothetical protein